MKTIVVSNTNLFRIAATELGSALQWVAIANINRLNDPMIQDLTTLIIPPPSASYADGIGSQ